MRRLVTRARSLWLRASEIGLPDTFTNEQAKRLSLQNQATLFTASLTVVYFGLFWLTDLRICAWIMLVAFVGYMSIMALNISGHYRLATALLLIVGNLQIPRLSGLSRRATVADLVGIVPQYANLNRHISAVMASTGQGRSLRDAAKRLNVPVNTPFSPIGSGTAALVRGDTDESKVDWGDDLTIQVLHPNHQRLVEMQDKWDKDLKKAAEKGDDSIIFASLGNRDTSPFNLASIVCLVEFGGKRILLTGDARDDDILDGLRRANRLDANDHIHVDILKIPHHGSDRNMSREFFERVTADHYVISGNGEYHNPEKATLVMLSDATRGRNDFTVHLTNHEGKNQLKEMLDEFIEDERRHERSYGFEFRRDDSLSLTLNLLDAIDY